MEKVQKLSHSVRYTSSSEPFRIYVSFIACVVLCAVFYLSVVCYFVWCVLFVCCVLL
jgi:hypothetical protein